jgi:alpha-ketoglutarate-dependent taurine dioxygenase
MHRTMTNAAWRADTIDRPEAWYLDLPEHLDDMHRLARSVARPVTDALENGRGFVIVKGPAGMSDEARRQLYWLIGAELGQPVEQNVQGTVLYDVRDTGQDVRYGARFSVTNAESSFHTDGSFFTRVVDYVGLLCLRPARSGGLSQVVSGVTAYDELRSRHPERLAALQEPFHIDRRGGAREGESPTARFPVLSEHAGGLLYRYLRFWIEAGHDRAGQPLSPEQRQALDALDAVLADPSLRAEFTLRPGEMLLFNNRWLLHNRTAFEDFPEPEHRRHLVRLWLARGASEPEA